MNLGYAILATRDLPLDPQDRAAHNAYALILSRFIAGQRVWELNLRFRRCAAYQGYEPCFKKYLTEGFVAGSLAGTGPPDCFGDNPMKEIWETANTKVEEAEKIRLGVAPIHKAR